MTEPGPDIHPPTNDDVFIAASGYSNWILRLQVDKLQAHRPGNSFDGRRRRPMRDAQALVVF